MKIYSYFAFVFSLIVCIHALPPVLFVPGDGGSQITGRLNRTYADHWYCDTHTDWFLMWLTYGPFLDPWEFTCFMDNARIVYNATTKTYHNIPGVETRTDPPGDTKGMEYLDSRGFITYFGDMIKTLRTKHNYTSKNLKGLTFDWRYTPVLTKEPKGEFAMLKQLVEELVKNNDGQKVRIVTHSLGGVLAQAFFENVTSDWRANHIAGWFSIGTPLYGAAEAAASFVSGYNLGKFFIPNFKLKRGLQSWPSTAWLLPNQKYWPSGPIVVSPKRNYSASWSDYKQFFIDLNWPTGQIMFDDVKSVVKFEAPEVDIDCVYGTGMKTPAQFIYDSNLPDSKEEDPKTVYGDGDGTVNIKSGMGCLMWQGQQKARITPHEIQKVEHVDLLASDKVIGLLEEVLGLKPKLYIEKLSAVY